jgi:glycosyltransferase involved in cell wall biosynthesis
MTLSRDLIPISILLFLTAIQLFYFLFFFMRLAMYRAKPPAESNDLQPVSIVISAFNEEANLKKNISKWLNQDYTRNGKRLFEVVIVNDNSQDDSFYYLHTLQDQYPHLHVVNLTQEAKLISGKKFPLSMGIKSARYERILLTDADCEPHSDQWLKQMTASLATKEIVLGYGPYTKQPGMINALIRFETFHTAIQYLSYALAGIPYMGVGRNLAYLREVFMRNKGFSSHHHIASGDDDLFINQVAHRRNTAIEIRPESFMYSPAKNTASDWRTQKKRHLSTGKYYKPLHKFLLGGYATSHFLFWLGIVPAILWSKPYIYLVILAIGIRWLVQWFIFQSVMTKLKEKDLIPWIWAFDIWLLWYNLKNVPSIFLKKNYAWR